MDEANMQIIEEIVDDEKEAEMDENLLYAIDAIAHDHMYLFTGGPPSPTEVFAASNMKDRICTLCGKTLSSPFNLRKHLDDCHNKTKVFQCHTCEKSFAKEPQLTSHLLCHTSLRIYVCPLCQKSFVRPETLKRHMRVHSDLKPYKCLFCDRQFKFRTPWKMHEATHSDDQPYECNNCGIKFSTAVALKEHCQEGNCTSQPFTCIDCHQEFSRRMDYLRHLNQHHGGKLIQKDFACTYCNKTFIYPSLLRVHERRHTGEEVYQCHRCGRSFALRYQLRNHNCGYDETPDNQVYLSCNYCSYQSRSKRAMSVHKRSHSDDHFRCQFCHKRFSQQDKWFKHMELCQNGVGPRPVPCPHCTMTFSSGTAQKIHQSRIHRDFSAMPVVCHRHSEQNVDGRSKPCHPCQVCGKCFMERGVLNKHFRVHTGERAYQCQYCGNRLTTPSALQNHERTHTGERPHKCTLCGKQFAQRTSLVEHVRRHTKNMPHKCGLCGKGFMVPSLLRKHQQTHFKNKTQTFCVQ